MAKFTFEANPEGYEIISFDFFAIAGSSVYQRQGSR
jgi:hypothetical protein